MSVIKTSDFTIFFVCLHHTLDQYVPYVCLLLLLHGWVLVHVLHACCCIQWNQNSRFQWKPCHLCPSIQILAGKFNSTCIKLFNAIKCSEFKIARRTYLALGYVQVTILTQLVSYQLYQWMCLTWICSDIGTTTGPSCPSLSLPYYWFLFSYIALPS